MLELTDVSYKDFIKEGKVVIKGFGDNCGFCDRYAPTVDKVAAEMPDIKWASFKVPLRKQGDKTPYTPSEFKRTYMKQEKGTELKESIPVTFVFENGEMKFRHFGLMTEPQLKEFVLTGKEPEVLQRNNQEIDKQKLGQLYMMKGEMTTIIEVNTSRLKQVNAEIEKLLGLGQPQ